MKWFKRIAIAFAALLLLAAAALWWLLGTGSGLRFALARAQAATDGALHVQQAQGRLLGPLDLAGIRYDDGKGTVATVAKAHLDLRFWPLLAKRLHVLALDVDGVEIALPKPSETASSSSGGFSLQPPIELILDRVHVGTVKLTQDGQPLFASHRLDLAGSWTDRGIELRQLVLQAPDGHANLDGKLAIGTRYQGNGKAAFAWKLGGTSYVGSLDAHSDGQRAQLDLGLTAPAVARLQVDLIQSGDYAWTGRLDAPRFDPKPLLGDSSLKALALAVQGHGDRHGGTLDGRLDLNDYQLLLQPLRAQFSPDFDTLTLQQLKLGSPQIKGSVEASGTVQLAAKPLSAALDIRWNDLLLPADLAGQALASRGALKASGSADAYHAEGDVDIGPPGKLAKLALNLDGTPQLVTLHTLQLKQAQGGLQAHGTLTLQPTLAWQAEASADKLDPGQLFAGWSGALDFDIASNGSLPQNGPDATLEIRQLAGKLRERAVSGRGKLHLSSNEVVDGQLDLASGGSTVKLDARPGASNDADLQLAIASLGDWLPDASGRLDGHFNIRGMRPKLSVNGQLHGQALAWQQQKADTLRLIVGIPDISHPAGKLDLQTGNAYLQGLLFQHLNLLAEGSQGDHQLRVDARGTQLSGELALHGALKGSAWNGTLSMLDLEPQGMPGWRLQQPSQLSYNDGAMSLSELCLSAGDPQLCVAAKQDKPGNLDASYRLQALPLALLLNASGNADLPLRADGVIEGSGKLRRSAAGALSGNASLSSAQGSVSYTDRADEPLLRYDQLRVDADLAPTGQRIAVHGGLDDGGRIDGQLTMSGAQQTLGGQLDLRLNSLAFVELFSGEVAGVKGNVDGNFRFGGTLKQPAVTGQANVRGFAAEVPSAGLKLSQGQLTVSTTDARQFLIRGSVQSGKGSVAIDGNAGLGADARTSLTLKGSQFTAADIPAARVVISPDLTVKQDADGIDIGGVLGIDSADVNAEKLPGAGATQASPDVVVVDEKQQQQAASKLPIRALVKVDLGRRTHIVGMGLDGRASGVLTVVERPGRATTGQGQIAVDGTYRAYGQNLQIQRGQLLFASTPIDNPGLNIRAVRKLNPNATIDEGQEVGLLVSGTAQRPILTVFSNPVMEQSDALSYLVTGKPLSQVKGGEGDMVGAAAQALGSAAGDLLAKSIGSKLGVDDVGVSSNEALGGSSAFTVGKYLSPRLYLSYGVGLFEPGEVITLRYRLSKRWNFEAQQATEFSRASFNYRIEK
ncbi:MULTISPECIES: translocation/assembly module TamB domain-containing protein [unclassified Rhodanobacter]|uniref:translocation/assembly module TamB domain-containing protein n=1 Tax=unclassified Rhodanobacter TaxID=2621553 RepID=UPI001BE0DD68|nr:MULTISPECIES: translocation/assembly module TamB domain-containing protein [unclassified Rhodanobacter]MBT2145406.1 translocation/assembly module TamB domain-containing protein [Rhodanobacter sp. LX-99]MBT2149451.1 translocation/assembly module TamB domain-containing protein [Rhodanobacter sp. LX-100]